MFSIRHVAIIGAGPSGLVAAKYLEAQGGFESIDVFEQQNEVGGVWNYSENPSATIPVPQNDPFFPPDPPLRDGSAAAGEAPLFPSPMYTRLHANIQGSLMKLQGQDFPLHALLFPSREDIQAYLVRYGKDVRRRIRFCYRVEEVARQSQGERDVWVVKASSTRDDEQITGVYDAVVIASGHYAVPFIPAINGIEPFGKAHPGTIIHSKHYRSVDAYAGKKVLVLGNGPSGLDLTAQVSRVSRGKPLLSVRHATAPEKLDSIGAEEVAEVEAFLVEEQGVRLKDGRVETGIDAIIACTGFYYSYPFFSLEFQRRLITTGKMVHQVYQHIFYIQEPTIAFLALNTKAVPWPLAEAQMAVVTGVWCNQIRLPETAAMTEWYEQMYQHRGQKMHTFDPLEDAEYINEMHEWAKRAPHLAKDPPWWNEEMFWERKIFNEAKLRFENEGCQAKTLGDLGIRYEPEEISAAEPGTK